MNEFQQEVASQGVAILALATHNGEAVRAIFTQGQWDELAVAVDDKDKSHFAAYMGACGVSQSPYAFVMKEGKLLHRGSLVD